MTRTGTFIDEINAVRHLMRSETETECGRVGRLREAGDIVRWSLDICDRCIRYAVDRRATEAAA